MVHYGGGGLYVNGLDGNRRLPSLSFKMMVSSRPERHFRYAFELRTSCLYQVDSLVPTLGCIYAPHSEAKQS